MQWSSIQYSMENLWQMFEMIHETENSMENGRKSSKLRNYDVQNCEWKPLQFSVGNHLELLKEVFQSFCSHPKPLKEAFHSFHCKPFEVISGSLLKKVFPNISKVIRSFCSKPFQATLSFWIKCSKVIKL